MECEGLLSPKLTIPLTLHRPTLCLLTKPPPGAGSQSWHWLCSQNISVSNEMWTNNFSSVPCTTEGSVEIRQAWLNSHSIFSLMEILLSSMSPSLLRDILSYGDNWDFPQKSKWAQDYPSLQGTWLELQVETMGTAQLVRFEEVQKI